MAGVLLVLGVYILLKFALRPPEVATERVSPHGPKLLSPSEFLVALAASAGFLVGLGSEILDVATVGGLLLGGVVAAPFAAWLVTRIPAPVLGSAVGGIIVVTNTRTVLQALDVTGWARTTIYAFVVGAWVASTALAIARYRRAPREVAGDGSTDQPTNAATSETRQ
jgi:uncharacterized membrane protein YfcA